MSKFNVISKENLTKNIQKIKSVTTVIQTWKKIDDMKRNKSLINNSHEKDFCIMSMASMHSLHCPCAIGILRFHQWFKKGFFFFFFF